MDQSTSTVWDFYQFPTSGVTGGTFTVSGAGKDNIVTGPGTGTHVTAPYFDEMAGMMRGQELQQGVINHAIFVVTSCDNGTAVYPSVTSNVVPCTDTTVGAPPLGSLLWLDYTDAQVDALGVPAWEKPILKAIHNHGAYVGDQGSRLTGHILINIIPEGRETYTQYGATQPFVTVANANGVGSNGVFYPFQFSGVNWASHLHVVDPCVPLGLTGHPGGCAASPAPPTVASPAPPTGLTATVK